jgi:hypothetical protein
MVGIAPPLSLICGSRVPRDLGGDGSRGRTSVIPKRVWSEVMSLGMFVIVPEYLRLVV